MPDLISNAETVSNTIPKSSTESHTITTHTLSNLATTIIENDEVDFSNITIDVSPLPISQEYGFMVLKNNAGKNKNKKSLEQVQSELPDPSVAIPAVLEKANEIANDNTHGYVFGSWDGIDFDCSSYVLTCLEEAGIPVNSYSGATYTGDMNQALLELGFVYVEGYPNVEDLKPGDVLFYRKKKNGKWHGHTEIYAGNGLNYGAHSNYDKKTGDSSGNEINLQGWNECECGDDWMGYYRYVGKSLYDNSNNIKS